MNNFFKHTSSRWVKYDSYEIRTGIDGTEYVTASENATPVIFDMLADVQSLILDALNTGVAIMQTEEHEEQAAAVMSYVSKYGLLGFMTGFTTNPRFVGDAEVYFTKNEFIKKKYMDSGEYIDLFFPFGHPELSDPDLQKDGQCPVNETMLDVDREFYRDVTAKCMALHREYAEPLDWLIRQFKYWAFIFMASYSYYVEDNHPAKPLRRFAQYAIRLFDTNSPSYHIELQEEHPVMVWDFHSLLLAAQMMICLAITDDESRFRICKQCRKVFVIRKDGQKYCGKCGKGKYSSTL